MNDAYISILQRATSFRVSVVARIDDPGGTSRSECKFELADVTGAQFRSLEVASPFTKGEDKGEELFFSRSSSANQIARNTLSSSWRT